MRFNACALGLEPINRDKSLNREIIIMKKMRRWITPVLAVTFLMMPFMSAYADTKSQGENTVYSLDFDASQYMEKTGSTAEKTFSYRAYEGIVYVQHPVDTTYQDTTCWRWAGGR